MNVGIIQCWRCVTFLVVIQAGLLFEVDCLFENELDPSCTIGMTEVLFTAAGWMMITAEGLSYSLVQGLQTYILCTTWMVQSSLYGHDTILRCSVSQHHWS